MEEESGQAGRRCGVRWQTVPTLSGHPNASAAAASSLTPPPIEYAIETSDESYGEAAKSARRTGTEHKRVLHRTRQLDLALVCRYSFSNVCRGRQSGDPSVGDGPAQQQGPDPQPFLPAGPRDFGQARLCAPVPGSGTGGRRAVPHLRFRQLARPRNRNPSRAPRCSGWAGPRAAGAAADGLRTGAPSPRALFAVQHFRP